MFGMSGEQVWGVVRTILAAVAGGWAAKKGIDGDTVQTILGGAGAIFIGVWSILAKKKPA